MSDAALGYCGLYCGACGIYQATRAGTPKVDDSGNALTCDGCNGAQCTSWCTDCAIKSCARKNGFRVCGECPENPCSILQGFMHDPKYPYHLDVQDNMKLLASDGLSVMANQVMEKYTCTSCGILHDWFTNICESCGGPLGKSSED